MGSIVLRTRIDEPGAHRLSTNIPLRTQLLHSHRQGSLSMVNEPSLQQHTDAAIVRAATSPIHHGKSKVKGVVGVAIAASVFAVVWRQNTNWWGVGTPHDTN